MAHVDVLWLDIFVQYSFVVHIVDDVQNLYPKKHSGLHRESSFAHFHQVMEARTDVLEDDDVEVGHRTVPMDSRYALHSL